MELFWSTFSCIWTEYREKRSISPYSVRMQEKAGQNNSTITFHAVSSINLSEHKIHPFSKSKSNSILSFSYRIAGIATFLASERLDSSIDLTCKTVENTITSLWHFLQETSEVGFDVYYLLSQMRRIARY